MNKFLLFALWEKEFNCVITKRIIGYFCEEKKIAPKPHTPPAAVVQEKVAHWVSFERLVQIQLELIVWFCSLEFPASSLHSTHCWNSNYFLKKHLWKKLWYLQTSGWVSLHPHDVISHMSSPFKYPPNISLLFIGQPSHFWEIY